MSLLENIDCQIEHCNGELPREDGDCCAGINENGKCVKGKYNADKGVCVISKSLSANRILKFVGIVALLILFLVVLYRVYKKVSKS